MTDLYENSENIFAHTSVPWQQRIIVDFMSHITPGRLDTCLDVGAGIGNNIETLLGYYNSVHATDVSERALHILCRRHANAHLNVNKMNAAALNYPDAAFDLVVCTEVLEHCQEPKTVLRECVRVLKPGGFLILSSPNYLNLAGAFKKLHEWWHPDRTWDAWGNHDEGRENFMIATNLGAWAKDAGTRIVSTCGGDLIRSWLPFLGRHYEVIDRHPFLGVGRLWPFKLFMMNYFILANKSSSRR